jgi:hypothetical protein
LSLLHLLLLLRVPLLQLLCLLLMALLDLLLARLVGILFCELLVFFFLPLLKFLPLFLLLRVHFFLIFLVSLVMLRVTRVWRRGPAYVGIMVGVLLAIVKALIWSKGAFTSEVFGYALAGAVIPGAIAYAIAGTKEGTQSEQVCTYVNPCQKATPFQQHKYVGLN